MNSPTDLRELLPEKRSGMPNASRGREKAAMSTLNPRAEINHAVTVVPILASHYDTDGLGKSEQTSVYET